MTPDFGRYRAGRSGPHPNGARLLWLGPADLMARLPIGALIGALPGLPARGGIESVCLRELETRLLEGARADAVLSPLFWQEGDVMEAARLLWSLDYAGPYRIVSPPLPRPGMVIDEVLACFPGLDVEMIPLRRP